MGNIISFCPFKITAIVSLVRDPFLSVVRGWPVLDLAELLPSGASSFWVPSAFALSKFFSLRSFLDGFIEDPLSPLPCLCSDFSSIHKASEWIEIAANKNVEDLDLQIWDSLVDDPDREQPYSLPQLSSLPKVMIGAAIGQIPMHLFITTPQPSVDAFAAAMLGLRSSRTITTRCYDKCSIGFWIGDWRCSSYDLKSEHKL
ncbi:hypothetical protein RND71_025639 [Anisodus tanguticus]|uniref:Uncharacterized protein n=1 Tax=Anisodus tanguticus TaxID=243964 RepID=A0AAE1RRP4_9SOLA|nr:hypothetical protein RND71_025639 [Anisodus tanguticus]